MIEKQSCTSIRSSCSRGSFDAGLAVGALRGERRRDRVAAVPARMTHLDAVRRRELQGLDRDHVALAERARDLGRRDDRARGAVADAAAVEQAERVGDHRRSEYLFDRDAVAQVRLRVLGAVLVALPRDVRHRALEVVDRVAVLGGVGGRELRECARRREAGLPEVLERALGALRQAPEAGVLELLDAHRERDVDRAGRDRIAAPRSASVPVAHRFSTRVTGTFGSRNAIDSGSPDLRRALLLVEDAEPGRLDAVALDAGVGERLGERLDHQVVGAASQRSPKREQPMPRIATLSLMPRATSVPHRCGFPEIAAEPAHRVEILDPEHEAHGRRRPRARRGGFGNSVKTLPPASTATLPYTCGGLRVKASQSSVKVLTVTTRVSASP